MEKEQDYWKAETVAFLALQSIRGVGFKTLYKIAAQKISFRELIKADSVEYFEKMLRQKLDDSIKESVESWMQFKLDLWNKGLELAREYVKKNIRIFLHSVVSSLYCLLIVVGLLPTTTVTKKTYTMCLKLISKASIFLLDNVTLIFRQSHAQQQLSTF
jgi:hypothetical protein